MVCSPRSLWCSLFLFLLKPSEWLLGHWVSQGMGQDFMAFLPGCFLVPMQIYSVHLRVPSFKRQHFSGHKSSFDPSPRAAGAYLSPVYITTKGHSWATPPPTKHRQIPLFSQARSSPTFLFQDPFFLLKIIELLFWDFYLSTFLLLEIKIEKLKKYIH